MIGRMVKAAYALPPPEHCDNCASVNIELTTNDKIYGNTYGDWPYIYYCNDCKAAVGCHPGTHSPLGKMANKEVRSLRAQAHNVFDQIWITGLMDRSAAYVWLSYVLDLTKEETHIALLSKENLEKTIFASEEYIEERKNIINRRSEKKNDKKVKQGLRIKRHIEKRKSHY